MALPFVLSRLAVAINILGNGFVTPHIDASAVAAGPLMISAAYAIIGPARSFLLSTGILISKLQGEIDELTKNGGDAQLINEKKQQIGNQLCQGILVGLIWAGVTAGMMLSVAPIMAALDVNEDVISNVRGFLNNVAVGLPAIYMSTCDQQFALATHRKNLPLFFGSLFPVLSMAIGYPTALVAGMGTKGLGLGMSAAAWISFIMLRLYFLKDEFKDYQLYKPQIRSLLNKVSDLCALGVPKAFQSLSEWGNLFVLSQLLVHSSKESSMAANASFQIISAFTVINSGLGQAISVKVAGQLGVMKAANDLGASSDDLAVYNKNSKALGNSGIVIGTMISAILAMFLYIFSKPIESAFLTDGTDDHQKVLKLGAVMLVTNGIGLIGDTLSNVTASGLAGSKDVIFAPVVRFLLMSAMALPVGWMLTNKESDSPNMYFIARNVGIMLSAFMMLIRWTLKDHCNTVLPAAEPAKKTLSSLFSRLCGSGRGEEDKKMQQPLLGHR